MNTKTKERLKNPWIYIVVTFAWTWLFWGFGILQGVSMESSEGFLILLLGVLGPMITGIGFTYLTRDKEGRRDYWKRVISFKRIPFKWYLIIILFVPVLNILAALIDLAMGGTGAELGETLLNALTDPLGIVFSLLFATLVPFIEELGWRGYVLDRFQERNNAFVSSLILGILWSVWHLPMFFIRDSYQSGLGVGTLEFWLFLIGVVPLGFAFTWIYNNTNRSTLAVILFHAMVNFTGELIALNPRSDTISILLWVVSAVGITLIFGAKKFIRKK